MPNVTVYVVTSWSNLPSQSSPLEATALNHIETGVKNVTDFVNTLNADAGIYLCGAPFTQALLTKLNGIETGANNYVLPVSTQNALGGVKIDGTTITIDANGVISSTTSGISELANLTDVDLDDLADGQILKWDATNSVWVNSSEAEVRTQLSLLEDVDIDDTSLEDGQVLKYNGTTEKWENGTGGGDVLDYDETIDILGLPPNPIYRYKIATPVMTSNTTPSGEASASSTYSSAAPYRAFTQELGFADTGECWLSDYGDVVDAWLKYEFDAPRIISRVDVYNWYDTRSLNYTAKKFIIQGSNDNTVFTDLLTCELEDYTTPGKQNRFDIPTPGLYKYYRFLVKESAHSSYVGFQLINMYEKYLA